MVSICKYFWLIFFCLGKQGMLRGCLISHPYYFFEKLFQGKPDSGWQVMSMLSSFSNVCSQLPILSIITSDLWNQEEKAFLRGFGSIHQYSCQDCPGFCDSIYSGVFSEHSSPNTFAAKYSTFVISSGLCPKPVKRASFLECEKVNSTEDKCQYKFYMLVYFIAPKIYLFLWDRPFFLVWTDFKPSKISCKAEQLVWDPLPKC